MPRLTLAHFYQLRLAKEIYFRNPHGITDADLAVLLRVSRTTAYRYRLALATYPVSPGHYSMRPTADDVVMAHTILLRQAHEDGNPHQKKRQ